MLFKDFWKSDFVKNILGKNNTSTAWTYGNYCRIYERNDKIFFKTYWNTGKQHTSKNFKKEKADNFVVKLYRDSKLYQGYLSVAYYLEIEDNDRVIHTFFIPNSNLINNKTTKIYEFDVIQKGPWYDENYKEIRI